MYLLINISIAVMILVLEYLFLIFIMARGKKRQEAERQAFQGKIADLMSTIEKLEYQLTVTEVDRDCAWNRLSDLEYQNAMQIEEEVLPTIAKEDARR